MSVIVGYYRQTCQSVSKVIQQIASSMENGEYDFDGTPDKLVRLHTYCFVQLMCE